MATCKICKHDKYADFIVKEDGVCIHCRDKIKRRVDMFFKILGFVALCALLYWLKI